MGKLKASQNLFWVCMSTRYTRNRTSIVKHTNNRTSSSMPYRAAAQTTIRPSLAGLLGSCTLSQPVSSITLPNDAACRLDVLTLYEKPSPGQLLTGHQLIFSTDDSCLIRAAAASTADDRNTIKKHYSSSTQTLQHATEQPQLPSGLQNQQCREAIHPEEPQRRQHAHGNSRQR
jgi:hypothetical protein